MTALSICSRALVLSLAEIALSVSVIVAFIADLYTSGITFCAAKLNLGSASGTSLSVMICGVVVNTSAACTLPSFSAASVIGPDVSSDEGLERQAVGRLQAAQPVGPGLELRRAAEREVRRE